MGTSKTNEILDKQLNLNEVLVSWKGPSHPFVRRKPVYFQTVAAITFLLSVISFFLFHDILLIGAIVSIAFVVNVVAKFEPMQITYKVTPLGFEYSDRLFRWVELSSFWMEEKWGEKVLVIQTRLAFPGQIRAVVRDVSGEKLKEVVGKYLEYKQKPMKSAIDHISDWLSRRIALDSAR
jgi:hypothetical protein